MQLLRTSHPGPTFVVTLVGFLMARSLTSDLKAFLIGVTIFTGQLCVGWTNDLVDYESDRAEGRTDKPIAQGLISPEAVTRATFITLAVTSALSLFGPLGIRGGLLHLLGVGCGVSYNFYFKRTLLSPLPYLIAFAAFPSAIVISQNKNPPIWLIVAGALFGLAAHFANVVKDMDVDRAGGVGGLPQLLGSKASLFIAGISLLEIAIILGIVTKQEFVIPVSAVVFISLFVLPKRFSFPLVLGVAVLDVAVLVSQALSTL
jgi:4-hydroxybenzoate polyprenyltransferase